MNTQPKHKKDSPCRLFAILAREAPVGVVFRRGPSDWVRLIKWNTADDTFEFGQWFHGRIYERRCDLSPDGSLLVYFVNKTNPKTLADYPGFVEELVAWVTGNCERRDAHYTHAWTAISRPPWLTALALWPKGDCWHGGGLFEANDVLCLDHWPGSRPHPNHKPMGLKVKPNPESHGPDSPIHTQRLIRDGWRLEQKGSFPHSRGNGWRTEREEVFSKPSPSGAHELMMVQTALDFNAYGGPDVLEFRVRCAGSDRLVELGRGTWADWDHSGRLVMAKGGKLFGHNETGAKPFGARLIHDFNDDEPECIESPPEAHTW